MSMIQKTLMGEFATKRLCLLCGQRVDEPCVPEPSDEARYRNKGATRS